MRYSNTTSLFGSRRQLWLKRLITATLKIEGHQCCVWVWRRTSYNNHPSEFLSQRNYCRISVKALRSPLTTSVILSCRLQSQSRSQVLQNANNITNHIIMHEKDRQHTLIKLGANSCHLVEAGVQTGRSQMDRLHDAQNVITKLCEVKENATLKTSWGFGTVLGHHLMSKHMHRIKTEAAA